MAVVSVVQASRRLGVDAKTLHRWLADAQFPLESHADDGRKKGVSEEQLHLLARLHQRSLAPFPEPAPAAIEGSQLALPAALLSLPEQLAAVQAQLATLQHQVSALTHLLQQHPQPSVSPARQHRASRQEPTSAPLPPRARLAVKPPRKPAHVIPRVEYGNDGHYVVICPKRGVLPFEPDTEEWFAWLAKQESFRFVGKLGHFSAHHEWLVPNGAWRAPRQIRNHSYNLRLAPNQELTLAVLEQAAQSLQAHLA